MNTFTHCHMCNRGGRGNDPNPCSAGWKRTKPSDHGCFIGEPIVGEPKKPPKLSRSQRRYRYWIDSGISDMCSYSDFIKNESRWRESAQEIGASWY